MKRIQLLSIVLILTQAIIASAAWDGKSVQEPAREGNTYMVASASELAWVATQSLTNDFAGMTIRLTDDIDLGGVDNDVRATSANPHSWTPIASAALPFQGTLDGNGHIVRCLYISSVNEGQNAGLISNIGASGVVRNLCIASGKIAVDEKDQIGVIAGVNAGVISHCFNQASIYMGRNRVGGLVGTNTGDIEYAYNTGIILQAKDTVGGICGYNAGSLRSVYNIGYTLVTSVCGSIVGYSAIGSSYNKVFFDQQIASQQGGVGDNIASLLPRDRTERMFSIFADDAANWVTVDSLYPALKVFASTDASKASVAATYQEERYAGVSKNFEVSIKDSVKWHSQEPEAIKVSGILASVQLDCNAKNVILMAACGNEMKRVYFNVASYKIFNPGSLYGEATVCGGKKAKVADIRYGTLASGGKDDDMKNYPYIYSLDIYRVNDDATETFIEHWEGNSQEFSNYVCKDDEVGTFRYYRKAHDSYCYTDWSATPGYFTLIVARDFTVGQIDTAVTDLCSLADSITVASIEDPAYGGGEFSYRWYYNYYRIDFETGTILSQMKDQRVPATWGYTDTTQLHIQLPNAGKYEFYRKVADNECSPSSFDRSFGTATYYAYEPLQGGEIFSLSKSYCLDLDIPEVISSRSGADGGNYHYEYRWLMDDEVIENSNTPDLVLADHHITFTAGVTHTFTREVRDSVECEREWVASSGSATITLANSLSPGSIESYDITECFDSVAAPYVSVTCNETQEGQGVGVFYYRWIMRVVFGTDTLSSIIPNQSNPSLINYHIPASFFNSIKLPAAFLFSRETANEYCPEDWIPSAGECRVFVSSSVDTDSIVSVCETGFPYEFSYTTSDGRVLTGILRDATDECVLSDVLESGCAHRIHFTASLREAPEVNVDEVGSVCKTDSIMNVSYHVVKGTPTNYSVAFNAAAKNAGYKDFDGNVNADSTIRIKIASAIDDQFAFTINFVDARQESACESNSQVITFSFSIDGILLRKYEDVIFVNNGPDMISHFSAFQWFHNGELVSGSTKQYHQENGGLSGSYFCEVSDEQGRKYRTCNFDVDEDVARRGHLSLAPALGQSGMENVGETQVVIYNCTGQIVASHIFEDGCNPTAALASSLLPDNAGAGMYVASFSSNNAQASVKFMAR